ncbi:protein FAM221A-like [Pecten maximus]|uniref:protein FAM221A-like n=1 Tax=Pecten maximus TaxID=6579 RepID=UPI0014584D5F|nr:protein FAM221A-like [Pecten maximus]
MAERQYHLKFGGNAGASVDAYLEYKRIVGEDDGGVLFTPEQYEAYKKKVLPMRLKNRIFTAWAAPSGMDCKLVGPETSCFCTHKYSSHKTDFENIPEDRPILLPCKVKGCGCVTYHYVPRNGSMALRCTCKHFSDDHSSKQPYKCKTGGCKCAGFKSSYTCGCGEPYNTHQMIVETKEERLARGHPVGQDGVPYQAMGGLTGFSSLMEGYMRLDPSGAGAPPVEFLDQPITSSDHPFLRGNVQSIKHHQTKQRAIAGGAGRSDETDADLAERMSAMRRPGETDMDYFERRYQERQKAERGRGRTKALPASRTVGKRTTPNNKPPPRS